MSEENALVPFTERYPAIAEDPRELMQLVEQNLGGETITASNLPKITVPNGDSLFWQIDGEDPVREIEGVVLFQTLVRAFWSTAYEDGDHGPPDCFSNDSNRGIGNPGGDCDTCKFAQYGSDPKGGEGQACRQTRPLYILRPGHSLPTLLRVPPTSLKSAKAFLVSLITTRTFISSIVVKLSLAKGKKNPIVQFRSGQKLSEGDAAKAREFADAMRPLFDATAVETKPESKGDSGGIDIGGPPPADNTTADENYKPL